jgi:MFS family permease
VGFGGATILFAFAGSFPLLLVARVLQGVAAAATWVAGLSMLADHFPSDQRGKAMSSCFACANLGLFLGPAFAGWMTRVWNIRAAFLFAAGLAVLDAVVRITLLPGDPPGRPAGTGYMALLKDRTVRVFAGAMVMGSLLGAVLEAVLPLHFSRHLGMDVMAIGLAFTTTALASIITSPFVGHWTDRRGALGPLRLGMVLAAALMGTAAFIPPGGLIYVFMLVTGSTCSLLMSPCGPAMAGHVERGGSTDFGSVFSLLNIAFSLGLMVGPMAGSALADLVGLKPAMAVLAAGFVAYLLALRPAALDV